VFVCVASLWNFDQQQKADKSSRVKFTRIMRELDTRITGLKSFLIDLQKLFKVPLYTSLETYRLISTVSLRL
jgi:hypothetical protein